MRTAHWNRTCEDCARFGVVGTLTHHQTGWPPHDPIEVCACWPGGGCAPHVADRLDPPCCLMVPRQRRCRTGEGPLLW